MGVIGRVCTVPEVVALRTLVPIEVAIQVRLRNRHDAPAGIATRASGLLQRGSLIVRHVAA
jgi:hypothetical protein